MALNKKYAVVGLILALAVAVMVVAQKTLSKAPKPIDQKETTLDTVQDEDDGEFPLLGFLFESVNREGNSEFDFNQVATESCTAKTKGVVDNTPAAPGDFKANACVKNDVVLYQVERLEVSNCAWTNQDTDTEKPAYTGGFSKIVGEHFEALKKNFVIENLKVQFKDEIMLCSGELIFPNQRRYPVTGNCAVASGTQFALVDGKRPPTNNDPLFVSFDIDASQTLMKEQFGVGPNDHYEPNLLISLSIPLTQKASDYLSYMLSNEAIEACDANLKK